MKIFHNTKNFTTVHYQFRLPSEFQKPSEKKLCVVSTRVVWNYINLVSEWPRQSKIIDKFAYGVLPERVDMLSTLFLIDINIIHGFTFRTHLLSTYEVRNMLKRPITLLKVLCALRIKEYVQILVW